MKKIYSLIALGVSCMAVGFTGCDTDALPEARELALELPAQPDNYNMGVNDAIPTLGRVLFYDKQLSVNNSVSCASCHKQAFAFADNVAFSRGFENRITTRNSMPIQNLSSLLFFDDFGGRPVFLSQSLFWDGREHSLEQLVLRPIVNHVEMGITDIEALEDKIQQIPYYKDLFIKAYNTDEVTMERIADAMSMFMRSIQSNNTKLDRFMFQGEQLTAMESHGKSLFFDKYDCNACHQVQSVTGYIEAGTFSNIGLDAEYADDGVAEITTIATDKGRFKIPSLRNVALTGPYMHDGRFKTLSEVIDHYKEGIADHPSLDPKLRGTDNLPKRFNISRSEKDAIIAFLNTLTDHSMVTDSKFSNPFKPL